MKSILILSTSDFGGAGLYSKELAEGLRKCGFEVQMLVAKKRSDNDLVTVVRKFVWQKLINRYARYIPFTKQFRSLRIKRKSDKEYYFLEPYEQNSLYTFKQIVSCVSIKPDVVIGCWTSGFLSFELLGKIGRFFSANTYVYTADMSPLTGGCHYAWGCAGYLSNCSGCPALPALVSHLAKENLQKKKRAVAKYNIMALAFSEFTLKQIQQSSLFKDQKDIPYFQGLVSDEYFYVNRASNLRSSYEIPEDRIVVVLGALNLYERRKGFKELISALNLIEFKKPELVKKMLLVAIGSPLDTNCSIDIRFLPFVRDMKILGDYYRLADIYANASLEDSGPQMLLQAMACGTIPVSFDTGFGSELVNGITGFKVPVGDVDSFSTALIKAAELSGVNRNKILASISEKIYRDNSLSRLQHVFSRL